MRDSGAHCRQVDDYVEHIVRTSSDPVNSSDKTEELVKMLRALTTLRGDPHQAADWLFFSKGFADVAGNDAYLHIEDGNFWTIANMGDFLSVLAKYKDDPDALYWNLFCYTPQRIAN